MWPYSSNVFCAVNQYNGLAILTLTYHILESTMNFEGTFPTRKSLKWFKPFNKRLTEWFLEKTIGINKY